jgi:hypothetical protein
VNRIAGAATLALGVLALGVGVASGWTRLVAPAGSFEPPAHPAVQQSVGPSVAPASTPVPPSVGPSVAPASTPLPQLPAWTLSAAPTLTLGAADGTPEELFHNVTGAVQLTDGSIAVVDAGRSVVSFFDGSGGHLRTVGGSGDGPGEFQFPRLIPATDYDSLVVHGVSRISIVGSDGRVRVAGSSEVGDLPRAVIPDGVIHQRFPHVDVNRGLAASSGLRPVDPDLVTVDPLSGVGTVLASYRYTTDYIVVSNRGQFNVPLPLRAGLSVAPMSGGEIAVVVGNEGVLRILRPSTGASSSIPLPIAAIEVTRADVQRITAERLARASARDPMVAGVIRELPFPDEFPFVESLVPDEAGGVWARLHPEHARRLGGDWLALGGSGEGRALIRMPEAFELFQVGADFVIGLSRDELGVQRVHRYDLYRTPGPSR